MRTFRRLPLILTLLAVTSLVGGGQAQAATVMSPTMIPSHVNWHRANVHGLHRIGWSSQLQRLAIDHAWRQARARKIFHTDISGQVTPGWKWIGQIVGVTCGYLSGLFSGYHASPSHRAILQYRYATRTGDAAVKAGNGCWYHVENFAQY